MNEKDAQEKGLAKVESMKPVSFADVDIPEAKKAFEKQDMLTKLAEKLLKDTDYMYLVTIVGSDKMPETFPRKDLADAQVKATKKKLGKEAIVTRVKKKAAWLRLGLHLGITVPPGQECVPVDKEIVPISDKLVGIRTTGPGYKSMTILGLIKRPDGSEKTQVLHSETTIAEYWPATGRVAVRSGACSSGERKFAHGPHDVIAMAETRASSRCSLALLGFGENSAEEFPEGETDNEPGDELTKPKGKPKEKPKSVDKPKKESKEKPKAEPAPAKDENKPDAEPEPAVEPEQTPSEPTESKEEEDTPQARKKLVGAAASALNGDGAEASKKIIGFFGEWKEKNGIAPEIKLSELDGETWKKFRTGLDEFTKAALLE